MREASTLKRALIILAGIVVGCMWMMVLAVGLLMLVVSAGYTEREYKCGDVYGNDRSHDIADADDCGGSDDALRSDGQFKDAHLHCKLLIPELARKDKRCIALAKSRA